MKTYFKKYKNIKTNTRKNKSKYNKISYKAKYTQQIVVLTFLQMLNTVKLYHWKTHSYAQHKATDELYTKLNENIDTFVEIMLGKHGNRVDLTQVKSIPLYDYSNLNSFRNKINEYKQFLINMTSVDNLNLTNNSDLLNVRDELLGNINQFEYLLTFN
jgi:DNA-binding ferritin-like protein